MSKKIWIVVACVGLMVVVFAIYAGALVLFPKAPKEPAIAPIVVVPPKSKVEIRDEERNAVVAAGMADYVVTSKADSAPPEIVYKIKTIEELTAKAAKEALLKSDTEERDKVKAAQDAERAEAVKKGLAEYTVTIDDKGKPVPIYRLKTPAEIADELFKKKAAESVRPAIVPTKPLISKAEDRPPSSADIIRPGE